jgi:hypothetical protein
MSSENLLVHDLNKYVRHVYMTHINMKNMQLYAREYQ